MIETEVRGIPDLKALLAGIPSKLRKRALRNALAAGARIVRDEARSKTPVLQQPVPYRKPGTVKKAISVRTSKVARRAGDVGVFVNVRPAKGAQRGAKSPNDPYFWRWLNFGTVKMRGTHFIEAGAKRLGDALQKFTATIGPQIQKLNSNPKDPLL